MTFYVDKKRPIPCGFHDVDDIAASAIGRGKSAPANSSGKVMVARMPDSTGTRKAGIRAEYRIVVLDFTKAWP